MKRRDGDLIQQQVSKWQHQETCIYFQYSCHNAVCGPKKLDRDPARENNERKKRERAREKQAEQRECEEECTVGRTPVCVQ